VVTPTVTTTVSSQTAMVGDKIHDTVMVGNAAGYSTTGTVKLYGPFDTTPTSTSCTGTPAWTGSVAVHGNGSYITADYTLTKAGYFTYQETLPGDSTHHAVTTPCSVAEETTLVSSPTTPTVTTVASEQTGTVGDHIHDTVLVANSHGYKGTVTVTLYGPFNAAPAEASCTGTPAWTGTVAVNGDGSYISADFAVSTAGYYTYVEALPADTTHTGATTPCGVTSETVLINKPVSQVQGITVGPVQAVTTPTTGAASGMLRSSIIGICLMISGLVVITGRRRNPHADV
jgi:hypothetical protein